MADLSHRHEVLGLLLGRWLKGFWVDFHGFLWLVSTQTQWFFSLISRWIRFVCLGQNVDFTMRLLFLLFGLVSSVHFLRLFPICHWPSASCCNAFGLGNRPRLFWRCTDSSSYLMLSPFTPLKPPKMPWSFPPVSRSLVLVGVPEVRPQDRQPAEIASKTVLEWAFFLL